MPIGTRLAIGVPIAAFILILFMLLWYKRRTSSSDWSNLRPAKKVVDSGVILDREEMYVRDTMGCGVTLVSCMCARVCGVTRVT